jgi:hypothetical protein
MFKMPSPLGNFVLVCLLIVIAAYSKDNNEEDIMITDKLITSPEDLLRCKAQNTK